MKYLIIGDIHLGINKDNPIFYDISINYANWIVKIANEKNIKNIVFLGDIFHNRNNISLSTLDHANKFIKIFDSFNIDIIVGNHDSFFLDKSDINSLCLLKNWKNITIHDKISIRDNMVFCGWGTKINDIPVKDIVFGHFDIISFSLSKNTISTTGFIGSELAKKGKLILSGHYHKPQGRKYNNNLILMCGSAFQLSWGESGEEKFIYILDTENCKIEKIKNDISPRFEYIRTEKDFDKIANNFISVQIENNEEGEKIIAKIAAFNPINIKCQIIEHDITKTTEEISDFKVIDIGELIPEFINNLENISPEEKKETIIILSKIYKELC